MYWLAEVSVKRPVFALMLITALVVAGIAAFPTLGVDRFPNMDMPQIFVNTEYVGAAAAEVESEISSVIEDAVATVAGIEELRSISADGRSFVIITIELDRDIDAAIQDVRDAVDGVPIRLSDLGTVTDSTKEVRTLASLNGEPAVVLEIQRQSGVAIIQDQSRYIVEALHEIERHLISGSILACLTVLLFMRSWRSTIIAAVAIPASIIASFAFMRWFGFTLNNVTMLALVLMVGVVIDDAIVVLENVFHCIEEKGMDPIEASIQGTREIALAVLATTISLVIVFLPVSFLSSVTGRMLFQFGVTATVAILISMLISFSRTPSMFTPRCKSTIQSS